MKDPEYKRGTIQMTSKNLGLNNVHLYEILPPFPSYEARQVIFRCTTSIMCMCEVMLGGLEPFTKSHNCDKLYNSVTSASLLVTL
jgi:hypothetical protein